MILQHIYMPIFNFIYDKITYRIGDRVRNAILLICFLGIFAAQFLSQYIFQFEGFNRGIRDYLICLFFGVILLASANKKLEIIKWRLNVYIPYTIAGLLILVASFDHEMGPAYQAFPLVMLTAFVCLFYIWGNRGDYKVLFNIIANAYMIFLSMFLLVLFVKYSYPDNIFSSSMDYGPMGINPNGLAKIFVSGLVCAMYKVHTAECTKVKTLSAVLAGAFLMIVVITKCRSTYIVLALIALCYAVVFLCERQDVKHQLINLFKYLAVGIFAAALSYCILTYVTPAISDALFPVDEQISTEMNEEVDTEAEERMQIIREKIYSSYNYVYSNPVLAKLDEITSSRVKIWTVYFWNMSWRGESELMFVDTEYAHNQYIELSYKAGIPTGIIYFIFVASVGVNLLINLFKKDRRKNYLYFQLLTYCVFAVVSMLDTGVLPFERAFIFMFYISAAPMFIKGKKDETK